jgi:hypothetical protein
MAVGLGYPSARPSGNACIRSLNTARRILNRETKQPVKAMKSSCQFAALIVCLWAPELNSQVLTGPVTNAANGHLY